MLKDSWKPARRYAKSRYIVGYNVGSWTMTCMAFAGRSAKLISYSAAVER